MEQAIEKDDAKKFYTAEDIANEYLVSRRTVYDWVANGKLKGRKVGNQWRFTRGDVEKLLWDPFEDRQPEGN